MYANMVAFIFIIMSILSTPVTSLAQQTCAEVFHSDSSIRLTSAKALFDFSNANNRFKDFFSGKHSISRNDLIAQVRSIEAASEDYFSKAGIDFDKIDASIPANTIFEGNNLPSISYHQYSLRGRRDGNTHSRLMLGIQDLKNVSEEAKVILDPLYPILIKGSFARYNQNFRTIFIQPYVLIYRELGISDAFRHEIQHHFEEMKIDRGEKSLARFYLFNRDSASTEPYAQALSLDELDTHIRDIRFMVKIAPRKEKTILDVFKDNEATELKNSIEQGRTASLKDEETRLRGLIEKSKGALIAIGNQVPQLGDNNFRIVSGFKKLNFTLKIQDPNYNETQITVSIKEGMTSRDVSNSILDLVHFSLDRIALIEQQLNALCPIQR